MKTIFDIVAGQPFFRGLNQEHLRTLADSAMQTWFETGELIFHDGDLANRFYLIVEGKVALESSVKDGDAVVLQTLESGDLLGWSWLFSPYVWRLHVWRLHARAVEPTEAVFFYGTRLREQCVLDHDFGYELFKRIAEVMMQRLQIARGRFLDHLATCGAASSARARTRGTASSSWPGTARPGRSTASSAPPPTKSHARLTAPCSSCRHRHRNLSDW